MTKLEDGFLPSLGEPVERVAAIATCDLEIRWTRYLLHEVEVKKKNAGIKNPTISAAAQSHQADVGASWQ